MRDALFSSTPVLPLAGRGCGVPRNGKDVSLKRIIMKIFGIIESYADFKHSAASNYGVCKTLEKAKKRLDEIIRERFEGRYDEDEREELEAFIQAGYEDDDTCRVKWHYDDGDVDLKFYIDELDVPDDFFAKN